MLCMPEKNKEKRNIISKLNVPRKKLKTDVLIQNAASRMKKE